VFLLFSKVMGSRLFDDIEKKNRAQIITSSLFVLYFCVCAHKEKQFFIAFF